MAYINRLRYSTYVLSIFAIACVHLAVQCSQDGSEEENHTFPYSTPLFTPLPTLHDTLSIEESFSLEQTPPTPSLLSSTTSSSQPETVQKQLTTGHTPKSTATSAPYLKKLKRLSSTSSSTSNSQSYERLIRFEEAESTSQPRTQNSYMSVWKKCTSSSRKRSEYLQTKSDCSLEDNPTTEYIFTHAKEKKIMVHLGNYGCTPDEFMLLITKREPKFHPKIIGHFALYLTNHPEVLAAIKNKIEQAADIDNKDDLCTVITQAMNNKKIQLSSPTDKTFNAILNGIARGILPDNLFETYQEAHASYSATTKLISTLRTAVSNGKIAQKTIDNLVTHYQQPEHRLKDEGWLHALFKISSFFNSQEEKYAEDVLRAASPKEIFSMIKMPTYTCMPQFFTIASQKVSCHYKKPYGPDFLLKYARSIRANQPLEIRTKIVEHLALHECISPEITAKLIEIIQPTLTIEPLLEDSTTQ